MPRPHSVPFSALLFEHYRRWYACLAVAVLAALVLVAWERTAMGQSLEAKTLDFRFQHFPIAERADTNIVLVT